MYNIGYITLIGGIATTAPMSFKFASFHTFISYLFFFGAFFVTPNN